MEKGWRGTKDTGSGKCTLMEGCNIVWLKTFMNSFVPVSHGDSVTFFKKEKKNLLYGIKKEISRLLSDSIN